MNIKEKPFQKGYSIRKRVLRYFSHYSKLSDSLNDFLFISADKELLEKHEGENITIRYEIKSPFRSELVNNTFLLKKSMRYNAMSYFSRHPLNIYKINRLKKDFISYIALIESEDFRGKNKHTFNEYVEKLGEVTVQEELNVFKDFYLEKKEDFSINVTILDKNNNEIQHIKVF